MSQPKTPVKQSHLPLRILRLALFLAIIAGAVIVGILLFVCPDSVHFVSP